MQQVFCNDELVKWVAKPSSCNSRRCCLRWQYNPVNSVTLDIGSTVFRRNVAGQHFQAPFSGSISANCFTSQFAHHRTNIDNLSMPLLHHRRNNRIETINGAFKSISMTLRKSAALISHIGTRRIIPALLTRDVNDTNILFDLLDHGLDTVLVCHVTDIPMGFDANFTISFNPLLPGLD